MKSNGYLICLSKGGTKSKVFNKVIETYESAEKVCVTHAKLIFSATEQLKVKLFRTVM